MAAVHDTAKKGLYMKNGLKRVLAVLLAAVMLTLVGCSNTVKVMELDGYAVTGNEYTYWLSVYKSYFLYYYNNSKDTVAFWESEAPDGRSFEEYATDIARGNVARNLAAQMLFDRHRLKLEEETLQDIKDSIAAEIDYYGSRSAFNEVLKTLGINVDMLEDIYIGEAKAAALQDFLYGENGTVEITEEEYAAYFADNYVHIKYMIIYTESTAVTDEEGNLTYDKTGEMVTRDFTEEEKNAIQARIEVAYQEAKNGRDFDELVKIYSDVDMSGYPEGFFLAARDCAAHDPLVSGAALQMEVGEVKKVESDYATFLIQKCPMPAFSALSEDAMKSMTGFLSVAKEDFFLAMLSEEAKGVSVEEEAIAAYSIVDMAFNPSI